jgi:hypothetical protein
MSDRDPPAALGRPEPKLRVLALKEARRAHIGAIYAASNGHPSQGHEYREHEDFDGFSMCPHPDCVVVRQEPPALGTLEPLPNRLRQHAHDLIHEGAVVSQLRADLFITAALIDSMLEREAARAAVRDTPQPEQEKSDVRIQPESGRVRPRLNEPTADRGMGSGAEAGHEQNCSALYFDGDYRAAVDETKCTCKKRLEAGRDTPPPQAQGEK